jgi:hypothetical protein
VATPETNNSGTRSFCVMSDGIIRYKTGEPLLEMVAGVACKAWEPLR